MTSFNRHSHPWKVRTIISFFRGENRSSGRLSDLPKVRVNKGRFKFHSLCSYLQLKEFKNRALGMFSEGRSIKHGTEQRQVKSPEAEEERKLPGQQGLDLFILSFI